MTMRTSPISPGVKPGSLTGPRREAGHGSWKPLGIQKDGFCTLQYILRLIHDTHVASHTPIPQSASPQIHSNISAPGQMMSGAPASGPDGGVACSAHVHPEQALHVQLWQASKRPLSARGRAESQHLHSHPAHRPCMHDKQCFNYVPHMRMTRA